MKLHTSKEGDDGEGVIIVHVSPSMMATATQFQAHQWITRLPHDVYQNKQTSGQTFSAALTVDSSHGSCLQFPPLRFQNQHPHSSLPLAEAPLQGVLSKTGVPTLTVLFVTSSNPNAMQVHCAPPSTYEYNSTLWSLSLGVGSAYYPICGVLGHSFFRFN